MKNLKKGLIKLFICCIALMIAFSMFLANASFAAGIIVVGNLEQEKKDKLLGTTVEKARANNVLGLAGEFSLFTRHDVTTYSADIEGRLAVGGNADFTGVNVNPQDPDDWDYYWPYQVGCGYNGYKPNSTGAAEVIANGSVKNLNLMKGAYTDGKEYSAKKTVVIQNLETTNSDIYKWFPAYSGDSSSFNGWWNTDVFYAAILFDFDEEFDWLKNQSQKLNSMGNGNIAVKTVNYSTDGTTIQQTQLIVLTGTNKGCNVFDISVSDYNRYFTPGNILFNVPEGSSIVVNIQGTGQINFKGPYLNESKTSTSGRILIPYTEEDKKADPSYTGKYSMYLVDSEGSFVKDSNGNNLLFVDISNDNNNIKAKNILYNVPNAQSITLKDNFTGSILAPYASAINDPSKSMQSGCAGHLSGNLVCDSYTGTMQFGFVTTEISNPFTTPAEDPKPEDPKPEDPKPEDPKPEDPKPEDPKPEDPKPEDPKTEDPKPEDPKQEDPKPEDSKTEDPKTEDPKQENPKSNNPATGDNIILYCIILGASIITLIIISKIKKNNKKEK